MKHLILYRLSNGMNPSEIEDGGWFEFDGTCVGVTSQPKTLDQRITLWELKDYLLGVHASRPFQYPHEGEDLTEQEVLDWATLFYTDKIGSLTDSDVIVMQQKILSKLDKKILRYLDQETLGEVPQDSLVTYTSISDQTQYTGKLALMKYRQDIRDIDVIFPSIEDIVWPTLPQ